MYGGNRGIKGGKYTSCSKQRQKVLMPVTQENAEVRAGLGPRLGNKVGPLQKKTHFRLHCNAKGNSKKATRSRYPRGTVWGAVGSRGTKKGTGRPGDPGGINWRA